MRNDGYIYNNRRIFYQQFKPKLADVDFLSIQFQTFKYICNNSLLLSPRKSHCKFSITDNKNVTPIIHTEASGSIKKCVNVCMFQTHKNAKIQLTPTKPWFRAVIIQVEKYTFFYSSSVLERIQNKFTQDQHPSLHLIKSIFF